jgi:ATP-dependent RNA helicase RhlE
MSKVLIFTDSKKIADKVYEGMCEIHNDKVGIIHSNKTQNARFAAVEGFENGQIKYLVATDIISRGLDIKEVSHVINFNTPSIPEDFIHRIGRTGRADADGIAITFTAPSEEANLFLIEEFINKQIELIEFPKEVVISDILIEEEKETIFMKNYLKPHRLKKSGGAFHEKMAKNVKVNLGGFAKKKAAIAKKIGKKYKNTR